jgi:hypothetical protein
MAAFLANPVITIGGVDLTGFCTAASVTERFDALEDTVFGMTARESQAGLGNHEATVTLYMDYSAAATYATLEALVGTKTTIIATPASGVELGYESWLPAGRLAVSRASNSFGVPR